MNTSGSGGGVRIPGRLHRIINNHVDKWFHAPRLDGQSPETTVKYVCDLFLTHCKRLGVSLVCPESQFRQNICEATCVMYLAHKQNTHWYGPHSRPIRPQGWTSTDESKWMEYLRFNCFTFALWQSMWDILGTTMWESVLPNWRNNMEIILLHYLVANPDCIEDMDSLEAKQVGQTGGGVTTDDSVADVEDVWY